MRRGNDLGRDSVGRLVLRLAIPTMIAQFVNILYSICLLYTSDAADE